jgi:large subunit ribosomal protein L31
MKPNIHPKYQKAKVTCSCGNSFEVGSTLAEIRVEICSLCHPFYTGKDKIIDTEGRVEKFQKRAKHAQEKAFEIESRTASKKARKDSLKAPSAPKSLREMLKETPSN